MGCLSTSNIWLVACGVLRLCGVLLPCPPSPARAAISTCVYLHNSCHERIRVCKALAAPKNISSLAGHPCQRSIQVQELATQGGGDPSVLDANYPPPH